VSILAALLPTPRCLERLHNSTPPALEFREARSWAMLDQICAGAPVDIAVVDLYADGTANFEALRTLRARYRTVSLVAYVAFNPDRAHDLFDLGRAGVVGLLLTDYDDHPRGIRSVVDRALARGAASELRRFVATEPPVVRDAVLVAVTRAHEDLDADKLAAIVGVSRRSLASALARSGFPSPPKLVTWGRLIVAGQMLTDKQRNADAVARTLAFPSGSAFRNTCQRYLHLRPLEIRAAGGSAAVVARFAEACGFAREMVDQAQGR
jgi:AraC-like DNA-binding protein